jgi:hypothetical protein
MLMKMGLPPEDDGAAVRAKQAGARRVGVDRSANWLLFSKLRPVTRFACTADAREPIQVDVERLLLVSAIRSRL